jgi:hypothetical protein
VLMKLLKPKSSTRTVWQTDSLDQSVYKDEYFGCGADLIGSEVCSVLASSTVDCPALKMLGLSQDRWNSDGLSLKSSLGLTVPRHPSLHPIVIKLHVLVPFCAPPPTSNYHCIYPTLLRVLSSISRVIKTVVHAG